MIGNCKWCDLKRMLWFGLCVDCSCKPAEFRRLLKRNVQLKMKLDTQRRKLSQKHLLMNKYRNKFYKLQIAHHKNKKALHEITTAHSTICKPYVSKQKRGPSLQKQTIYAMDGRGSFNDSNDPQRGQD
jgi:hypothetical protein